MSAGTVSLSTGAREYADGKCVSGFMEEYHMSVCDRPNQLMFPFHVGLVLWTFKSW